MRPLRREMIRRIHLVPSNTNFLHLQFMMVHINECKYKLNFKTRSPINSIYCVVSCTITR